MPTATSASATWRAPASASLNTATEQTPIARSVRMTRTAISPRLATRTVLKVLKVIASHPEYAVGDRLERGLSDDRQRQPQHSSGVGGIDDPVIPEPGGGGVGIALAFVLFADPRLELLFLLRGHLAPHTGQHRGPL